MVHEHEYDDAGRLLRTVVVREPEWDADERAWMLGLAVREAAECQRCGGDLVDTLDWNFRWEPQLPSVCLRCVALQASEQAHEKHPNHRAMIHRVVKRVRPQPKKKRKGR